MGVFFSSFTPVMVTYRCDWNKVGRKTPKKQTINYMYIYYHISEFSTFSPITVNVVLMYVFQMHI